MKKAIVTGATGFIGKFLVRELVKQNVEVIAVVRRGTKNLNTINALPVKIVECNIADYHMLPDMIADRDIDVVFHIAWQGVSDLDARNEAIQMQNLQSTLDLIDAMHIMRIGCFIGCGSMHEAESLVEMNEDRVYNSYLHYLERKMKSKIKEFIFRDKIGGWHKHVEKIIYENGKIEYRDGYTQLFYTNLPLRRSCGECPFSTIKRCGDFTVGDFWGVQDVLPEFDDNKGVSLLFFNNDRALERFDSFKEMLKYQEISVTDAVRQPNLKGHSVIPKNVNAFWRDFQKKGIGYCISFYSPAGIPFRIKRKIKYIYSKVTRK